MGAAIPREMRPRDESWKIKRPRQRCRQSKINVFVAAPRRAVVFFLKRDQSVVFRLHLPVAARTQQLAARINFHPAGYGQLCHPIASPSCSPFVYFEFSLTLSESESQLTVVRFVFDVTPNNRMPARGSSDSIYRNDEISRATMHLR